MVTNNFKTRMVLKTIENESLKNRSSMDLSNVIFFFGEYQSNSVLIACAELFNREYSLSGACL